MLNIVKASREGAKTVIGLAGQSGSGKTYSAILLAYGIAKRNASKVGVLDTENRRGRLYADILPNGEQFLIADLPAPFSPARYAEAIREWEKAGIEVLVIDSVSHEWEGMGGCEDIAMDGVPPNKPGRWNLAKAEHKKFMNALLQSSMHIIVSIRAREKVKIGKDPQTNKTIFIPQGIQPIQEKNFMFELTASLMMYEAQYNPDGSLAFPAGARQEILKMPDALAPILGRQTTYLTIEDGEALRAWIDGGKPVNREAERAKANLSTVAETQGLDALTKAWEALPKKIKAALKDDRPELKATAEAFDKQRKISASADSSEGSQAVDRLIAGDEDDPPEGGGDGSEVYGKT